MSYSTSTPPNTTLEPTRQGALGWPRVVRVFLCFRAAWLSFRALGVATMRNWKSQVVKVSVALIVLSAFYFFDGLKRPHFDRFDRRDRIRLETMWQCSVVLVVLGTYAALWGNRIIGGPMHPTSLRSAYIIVGALAVVGGFIMMRSVRWVGLPPNTTLEPTRRGALGSPRVSGFSCVLWPRGSAFER
jgi:hypothetical protein